MKEDNPYIRSLFRRYLDGTCSDKELDILLAYFNLDEDTDQLKALISKQLEEPVPTSVNKDDVEAIVSNIKRHLIQKVPISKHKYTTLLWKQAAIIFLIFSIGTGVLWYYKKYETTQLTSQFGDDVLPGGNHAYITLSTGQRVDLDSTQSSMITQDGKHAYADGTELLAGSVAHSVTVHTPVGGQYHIVLPDGSEAWLNAASTLTYPVQFEKGQRQVETTGEVYLEVKPDRDRPFIVKTGEQDIRVLGTAFNVRDYGSSSITTLVSGSVAIQHKGSAEPSILLPGEQAILGQGHIEVKKIDPTDYIGWKDGMITLTDASLQETCRELERWYDITFIYPARFKNNELAYNSISRSEKLSVILEALKSTYRVDFEIRGKEVLVK